MLINQQIQSENVDNPLDFLPSVTIDDMVDIMRVDKTIGTPRIAEYIINAYDTLNPSLPSNMKSADYLLSLDDKKREFWERTYKRAIMHEATAQFVDNHPDYDTTGTGIIRGDNEQSKSDKLRRIYNHCVADLTGRTRNRIRLL